MSTSISLEDLVGPHVLTAVNTDVRESDYRMADSIAFTLDGQTYLATEDADDSYRSSMDSIRKVDFTIPNFSTAVPILARMSESHNEDILELLNAETGKVILRVGTDNIDDYYPSWVAEYNPENLL